ncbi:MAG: GAF domain-containing protein [Myxococcales bacterium]|nr:GAF domain-containing protein [Myxococcales bacterium]MCB9731930.1 GAF domain-containing protein [Deltaproteobacteria bacterium]
MSHAPPPLAPDEPARLDALRAYHVLDTPPEAAFDDLVSLTAAICDVPIALVSLIDRDRQWFKARVGLAAAQTRRDEAFCAYAILAPDDVLIVPDALSDPRFADNPLVTGEPHIRFYAGAPLRSPEGHALGTLCVIDRVPRSLDARQRQALEALSRQVVAALEQRRQVAELAERNRELQRFTALAAHDLRSPLRGVQTLIDVFFEDHADVVPSDGRELLERAQRGARRMSMLIDDLLAYARLNAEVRSNAMVDLGAVVDAVVEELAPAIEAAEATVTRGELPTVFGSETELRQLFRNLVSNALKFGRDEEPVRVDIVAAEVAEGWRVRVRDNGVGIDADYRETIFEPFVRLHAQSEIEGTGIGLAIVAKIMGQHHGEIACEAVDGPGACFALTFPRPGSGDGAAPGASAAPPPPRP